MASRGFQPRGAGFNQSGHGSTAARDPSSSAAQSMLTNPKEPQSELKAQLPSRPGYGKAGKALQLHANYFQLDLNPGLQLHRYAITIEPEVQGYRKKRRLIELLLEDDSFREHHPTVATDYEACLFSAGLLNTGPPEAMHFEVKYYNELGTGSSSASPTYNVDIAYDEMLPLDELLDYLNPQTRISQFDQKKTVINALNAIMAQKPSRDQSIVSAGRNSKFFPLSSEKDLGDCLYVLRGYYASVRSTAGRLLVNLNSCTSAFYHHKMDLEQLMTRAHQENIKLGPFLLGLRVGTTYLKSDGPVIKTIAGVGELSASETKFYCKELDPQNEVSVEDYFKRKHGITLQHPDAPVVDVRVPNDNSSGNSPVWLPPELCKVLPHQLFRRVVPPHLTSSMINIALQKPEDNAGGILGQGCQILGIAGNQDDLRAFGLKVQPKMITVEGRILPTPKVTYRSVNPGTQKKNAGTQKAIKPKNGSWNLVGMNFSTVRKPDIKWTYLSLCRLEQHKLESGLENFEKALSACGISRARRVHIKESGNGPKGMTSARILEAAKASVDLLLVILPRHDIPLYSKIKYCADVEHGIHTVCAIADKFSTQKLPYFANLTLKVNLKAGGVNQSLKGDDLGILKDGKTIVIGYDVTHPSPIAQRNTPSIAGLVASIDGNYAQWAPSVRLQLKAREEMVKGPLREMVKERLIYWQKCNGSLPSKILVYRDGVSEGQYPQVLKYELPGIRGACQSLYKNKPLPQISILVVGKRHHTRMFTKKANGDVQGNPEAGTILDNGIAMEKGYDFFLQPHHALKGTARPIHYVVVHDEIGLGVDELQKTTHNLSYMYGRATKAVSVCPPAYFADLLCDRARCYLYEELSGQRFTKEFDEKKSWNGTIHPNLQNTMFYI